MANHIEYLESLPDIDLLSEQDITLENIIQEMIDDYEEAYKEVSGEERILYPADPIRLLINITAGQIYQAYEFGQELFKQNFIRYMEDDVLLHWGANLGYELPEPEYATTVLEFTIQDALDFDVVIPAGTRVTAGDDVFFATDIETQVPAGEVRVEVPATCTESGSVGNDYAVGQLSTVADPFPYMGSVRNLAISGGGTDAPSGEDLKEEIYRFPSTYSVAGPEDEYIALVTEYSAEIADASLITDFDAKVNIYVLLKNGKLPSESYLAELGEYFQDIRQTPDTDYVLFHAPSVVNYQIRATYYILSDNKDNETALRQAIEEAVSYFADMQKSELGLDLDPGELVSLAKVAGAKRIVLDSPEYISIAKNQVAICSDIELTYGGLEG